MPNPRAQKPLSFDQIIKDAKSLGVPAQALLDALAGGLKGSVTATAGAPADIYNLLNQVSFRGQLPTMPYGSEDISKMLPDVVPTQDKSRQHTAEVGETMGNFIPTPMAGQALKGAVKLGAKGAKALGEEAGRRAVMGESFTPFVNTAIPQTNVMKPKGGNWFKNEVEDKLKRLKSAYDPDYGLEDLRQLREQYGELPAYAIDEQTMLDQKALNNWVDKNLTNYIKKELATPEDPVRLVIDSRVNEANEQFKVDMARANKVAQRAKEETDPRRQANFQREANRLTAEANNNLELGIKHSSHLPHDPDYLTPEDIKTLEEMRQKEGFPAKGMGKSDEAKAYEMNADISIYPKKASSLQELPERLAQAELAKKEAEQAKINLDAKLTKHLESKLTGVTDQQIKNIVDGMGYAEKEQMVGDDSASKAYQKLHNLQSPTDDYNLKRLENNQYINKLTPETNIYSAQTGDLGFDHIIDVLKEDLASGRMKPEELKNISMEQAVRKTADYDLALAKKMQEAQAKNLENMTVHKEYPEGLKWVQLDKPGQFSAESNAMGHSVRGYEPPKGHPDWVEGSGDEGSLGYGHGGWEAIKSGKAKVYSLVDPKGNPHTTVEIKSPKVYTEDDIGLQFPSGVLNAMKNNGETGVNEYVAQKLKELNSASPTITQIKGKGNGKPVDTYIPYVQDFVKSGNWSDVGDLRHTDLSNVGGKYYTEPELIEVAKKYGRMGVQDTPWEVARQRHIDAGVPEEEALANWVDAFRDGRGRLDIPPEPPIQGMKQGGSVSISNNPDTMYMELMDKKMKGGGSENDTKASFGVFPQLKPYRENQDPEASKDMPLQAVRGRFAGTLGFIPDMANIPLAVVNAIKGTNYKVPYGTEHWLETLPLKATSPAGELSGEAGSFFPSTAMIKAQLQGLKGLGKIAGEGLSNASMGEGPEFLKELVPQPKFAVEKNPYKALPLDLKRYNVPDSVVQSEAERVVRQMTGEHVPKAGATANLAGRSLKESNRVQDLDYKLQDVRPDTGIQPKPYEPKIGDVNVGISGDQTISDYILSHLSGEEINSLQQGGAKYGLGKQNLIDPLFWASEGTIAQRLQDKITDLASKFNADRVIGQHLAMGPISNNFAQHFADANMRAIDYTKLKRSDMDDFNKIIREGYFDPKKKKWIQFPEFAGIDDPHIALAQMESDPNLRKWFNNRMKTPNDVTKPLNLPNGLDVQWAITEPELRNKEINLTGLSVGQMRPNAPLTDTANHFTYSKGIQGKAMTPSGILMTPTIAFPDATAHILKHKRASDYTGTLHKVFPHQVVDQQYLDKLQKYQDFIKARTGKKKGGAIKKAKGGEISEDDIQMEVRPL